MQLTPHTCCKLQYNHIEVFRSITRLGLHTLIEDITNRELD